ncbi:MAG: FKBP-type peptidyl-prolyl cis-trans isomerase [bacterium]|nr:FKBP-type peptidyl-prolyl cis-trans isomerase [bacterium]
MNFSKQEWYTLSIGLLVIIIIIAVLGFKNGSKAALTNTTIMNESDSASSATPIVLPDVAGNNISTDAKIKIIEEKTGTGKEAIQGSNVYVHYTGTFVNGTKFDSSRDRGEPINFPLGTGAVIKGWDVGLMGMKVGGKRKLVISPEYGYGPNNYGPIPGNSVLMFDVELVDVK